MPHPFALSAEQERLLLDDYLRLPSMRADGQKAAGAVAALAKKWGITRGAVDRAIRRQRLGQLRLADRPCEDADVRRDKRGLALRCRLCDAVLYRDEPGDKCQDCRGLMARLRAHRRRPAPEGATVNVVGPVRIYRDPFRGAS
jgi:hypothetical protein